MVYPLFPKIGGAPFRCRWSFPCCFCLRGQPGGFNWKRICIFPWNNLILSVSPQHEQEQLSPPSGALASGREKEGDLATTSLELEYLHRKSLCEMLIGGDDISNDVIALGTCFSTFVYIYARFHFALMGGNLTAQSTGNHMGI